MNKTNERNGPVTKRIEHHQSSVNLSMSVILDVMHPLTESSENSPYLSIRDPPTERMDEPVSKSKTQKEIGWSVDLKGDTYRILTTLPKLSFVAHFN